MAVLGAKSQARKRVFRAVRRQSNLKPNQGRKEQDMKRFYKSLLENNGEVTVTTPNGTQCKIVADDCRKLSNSIWEEPFFDIFVDGQHKTTISKRWNWDDFIAEWGL